MVSFSTPIMLWIHCCDIIPLPRPFNISKIKIHYISPRHFAAILYYFVSTKFLKLTTGFKTFSPYISEQAQPLIKEAITKKNQHTSIYIVSLPLPSIYIYTDASFRKDFNPFVFAGSSNTWPGGRYRLCYL